MTTAEEVAELRAKLATMQGQFDVLAGIAVAVVRDMNVLDLWCARHAQERCVEPPVPSEIVLRFSREIKVEGGVRRIFNSAALLTELAGAQKVVETVQREQPPD